MEKNQWKESGDRIHRSVVELRPMRKKTERKKDREAALTVFRERKLKDILPLSGLKHPKPVPGYKSTLPGAPGSWAKDNPGA